ncbi:unnamed protein product [Darwinula stevensoni]|uniref:Uncharacterized protein n=1 Tax=Darwinula stevensoni TaxID=69355 RepID=A0A7R9AAR1_9CRUS|nr:unnamed protein product [Darwinula stevensoni]CAG0898381.1 unnamed protein product [Darwinula stevensoni]
MTSAFVLLSLLSLVGFGSALNCYQCNSADECKEGKSRNCPEVPVVEMHCWSVRNSKGEVQIASCFPWRKEECMNTPTLPDGRKISSDWQACACKTDLCNAAGPAIAPSLLPYLFLLFAASWRFFSL